MKYKLNEETVKEMAKRFTFHAPTADLPVRYTEIRETFLTLAFHLCQNCPQGRELSLALTKLEESCMWANAAIARNE